MQDVRRSDRITLSLLAFGVAVPLLYYGVQVVAAPFFPGFSFLGTTASELGSDLSTLPSIFNAGTILLGAARNQSLEMVGLLFARTNDIVPFAVEAGGGDTQGFHVGFGDFATFLVEPAIDGSLHNEPCGGSGRRD